MAAVTTMQRRVRSSSYSKLQPHVQQPGQLHLRTGRRSVVSRAGPDFSDPARTVVWGGKLPGQRRAVLGFLSGLGIALGGNLGGVTSGLLSLDGGAAAGRLRLDVIIPVNGLKRAADYDQGFEFQYPSSWLADQTLLYRAAEAGEAARRGDLPPLKAQRRRDVVLPTVAFGPPGSSGEENVSVVVAPITEGFTLESLGRPEEAAATFLRNVVAPEGSPRTAQLITVSSRKGDGGQLYYCWEYSVRSPAFSRYNIAVLTARSDQLFTFNAQCPEAQWEKDAPTLRTSSQSFKLMQR